MSTSMYAKFEVRTRKTDGVYTTNPTWDYAQSQKNRMVIVELAH
jgi:hypothetical protein